MIERMYHCFQTTPDTKNMQETKYVLHGYFQHSETYRRNDSLGYIKSTMEDAIETCNRINPNFTIEYITIEN
jgi:hypothetical protein